MNRIYRIWYYFRMGYGTYLGFAVGILSNVLVIYAFGVKGVSLFSEVFPREDIFFAVSTLILVPLASGLGWFHVKRLDAFRTDVVVATEQNPYIYKALPGKELEVYIPLYLLMIRSMRGEKIDQSTLEELEKKCDILLKGEPVG